MIVSNNNNGNQLPEQTEKKTASVSWREQHPTTIRATKFKKTSQRKFVSEYNICGNSVQTSTSRGALPQTAIKAAKFKKSSRRVSQKIFAQRYDTSDNFVLPYYPKSVETLQFLSSAILENFVFSSLNDEQRRILINAMSKEFFPKGAGIIHQGDQSDFFYVVERGNVEFYVDWKYEGTCGRGYSFGELSLLYDCPRAASCIAETDCTLWKVDKHTFCHLTRQALGGVENVCKTFKRIPCFFGLDHQKLTAMVMRCNTEMFMEGQRIVSKGKIGQKIHMIREGKVKVHDIGFKDGQSRYDDYTLGPGDFFGERSLWNVTAISNCITLSLSRDDYSAFLGCHHDMLNCANRNIIRGIPFIANLKLESGQIYRLAELFEGEIFVEGKYLVKQSEPVAEQGLYIIQSGRVIITNDYGVTYTLSRGDYFGDNLLHLEEGSLSKQTVRFEQKAICSVLTKSSIESVIGRFSHLVKPLHAMAELDSSIEYADIEIYRTIGVGSLSRVRLASHRHSGKPYALKMISKSKAIKAKMEEAIIQERNILAFIHHPFIVNLVSTFQDDHMLYLLLDFVQGGELFTVIHTDISGIPTDNARFYAACILEALSHLHQHSICYRNLVPENVLIDKDGYCKLVNFKYAKVVMGETHTFCGTPDYLAPEIILHKGHNKDVDYWAFGVLIYEMIFGNNPFFANGMDKVTLFKQIVKAKFFFPMGIYHEKSSEQLISGLLTRRQTNRIGHDDGDMDIRKQAWFVGVDFTKILKKKIQAPWLPKVKGDLDPSNFDTFDDLENNDDKLRQKVLSENQERFHGF